MDIGKSFTYVFDDEEWIKKVLIGGVLGIIPIVNFVVAGYAMRVLKNVAEGEERPLPEWDDWGGDWVKGALLMVGAFIYGLPAIVVSGLGSLATWLAGSSSSEGVGGVMSVCLIGTQCLTWLWGLVMAVYLPAAITKYAMEGEFGSMFRFTDILAYIRENLSNYLIAVLLSIVAQIVAGFGTILCVIGVIFTSFWGTLASVHLLGQVQAESAPASGGGYGELSEGAPISA